MSTTKSKPETAKETCPFCDARMERWKGRTDDYMRCTGSPAAITTIAFPTPTR